MPNSVMTHQFSQVPNATISRSSFDRSHGYKTTLDAGYLVPIYVDEALPGDTFNLNMTGFARMATPIKPVMDNMFMETFFFAVPNRLVWDKWEDFAGNNAIASGDGQTPGNATNNNEINVPVVNLPFGDPSRSEMGIYDYYGIPIHSDAGVVAGSMPFRAYNLIWNEWFRDQNLQDPVSVPTDDGDDLASTFELLRRGKRHDYFTSCLPWPQRGEPVTIPIGDQAPVITSGSPIRVSGVVGGGGVGEAVQASDVTGNLSMTSPPATTRDVYAANASGYIADLSNAQATSINDFRIAFQLQRMLERDARGGTRYPEVIHAHFGVTSPDARLQRPEYLGGGRTRVNVNPVEQTAATDGSSPQGNLAAFATAMLSGHGFTKSFTEHCYIIGLVNIRADLTYQEGLNRMYMRRSRYDYFWPSFQHIGEQGVFADEIYASSDNDTQEVFGYQENYAEYRYFPSKITGLFRSSAAQSLDVWHLSQDFDSTPQLNSDFIEDNPPLDRVIAIPSEPHFLLDSYIKLRCARPMPLYGVPGNIDRF